MNAAASEATPPLARALARIDALSATERARLAARRIWFGHQSVGENIIEGVRAILAARPALGLRVITGDGPSPDRGPALVHGRLGANLDPGSKLGGFAERLENAVGTWADLALFKYCYADVHAATDVGELFERHVRVHRDLSERFPHAKLLHCTVPLTAPPSLARRWAKRLLGKPVREFADNTKRAEFNALLRAHCGDGCVVDIARAESTRPDGGVERNGTALYHGYTADRGHLNEAGALTVAAEFLVALARVPA